MMGVPYTWLLRAINFYEVQNVLKYMQISPFTAPLTFFVDGILRVSVLTQKPHSSDSSSINSRYLAYKLLPRPFSLNFLSKSHGQHGKTKNRHPYEDLKYKLVICDGFGYLSIKAMKASQRVGMSIKQ